MADDTTDNAPLLELVDPRIKGMSNNIIPFSTPPSPPSTIEKTKRRKSSTTLAKTRDRMPASLAKKTPGTIAFLLKSIKGGSETLRFYAALVTDKDPRIQRIVQEFDSLSSSSKPSNIWDTLCSKHSITIGEFWGSICRIAIEYNRDMAKFQASQLAPDLALKIMKHGMRRDGIKHAELGARITGLDEAKAGIAIQNNQTFNQVVDHGLPKLEESANSVMDRVKEERARQIEALNPTPPPSASSSIIEGEIVTT